MSLTFYFAPNSTASITEAVLAELCALPTLALLATSRGPRPIRHSTWTPHEARTLNDTYSKKIFLSHSSGAISESDPDLPDFLAALGLSVAVADDGRPWIDLVRNPMMHRSKQRRERQRDERSDHPLVALRRRDPAQVARQFEMVYELFPRLAQRRGLAALIAAIALLAPKWSEVVPAASQKAHRLPESRRLGFSSRTS